VAVPVTADRRDSEAWMDHQRDEALADRTPEQIAQDEHFQSEEFWAMIDRELAEDAVGILELACKSGAERGIMVAFKKEAK